MIIQCPNCQGRFKFKKENFGAESSKKVRCTQCKTVFTVLNPDASKPAPAASQVEPERRASHAPPPENTTETAPSKLADREKRDFEVSPDEKGLDLDDGAASDDVGASTFEFDPNMFEFDFDAERDPGPLPDTDTAAANEKEPLLEDPTRVHTEPQFENAINTELYDSDEKNGFLAGYALVPESLKEVRYDNGEDSASLKLDATLFESEDGGSSQGLTLRPLTGIRAPNAAHPADIPKLLTYGIKGVLLVLMLVSIYVAAQMFAQGEHFSFYRLGLSQLAESETDSGSETAYSLE